MKNLLVASYCFPPVASPEAYVAAKLMGALRSFNVDMISADHRLFPGPADHSLDQYVSERFRRIERVTAPDLLRMLMPIPRLPLRPDRYVLLRSAALRCALDMDPRRYDAVMTRSQYHSSHLVGLALKRRFPRLPWIVSISDPWNGGIYERTVPIFSSISLRFEKAVLSRANGLIFPTRELRDFVADQHHDIDILDRSTVIPHGYDPVLYPPAMKKTLSGPILVRMFGSFYGPRSPQPLLKALGLLLQQQEMPDFRIEIYGRNARLLLESLANYPQLGTVVRHKGEVNHASALDLMADADILLMIDASMPPPSIFMPSKLADYIGADRPILAITPEGAAANIVRSVGGQVADPQDSAAIAADFRNLLLEVENRSGASQTSPGQRDAFRQKYVVTELAGQLDSAIERAIAAAA